VGEFIFNAFINLEPMQRPEDGCDMGRFTSAHKHNRPTCKTVRKIVVERVTVVKFEMEARGRNGTACFRIKVRTDVTEFTIRE